MAKTLVARETARNDSGLRYLLVRAGTTACAFPLRYAIETMRPRPIAQLRGVPEFVLGVAIVRGQPVPVVHLGRLLRAEGTIPVTRFATLRLGSRCLALAVQAVMGVREMEPDDLTEFPSLLGPDGAEVIEAIGRLDAELLVVLSAMKIVPEPVWEALSARSTAS